MCLAHVQQLIKAHGLSMLTTPGELSPSLLLMRRIRLELLCRGQSAKGHGSWGHHESTFCTIVGASQPIDGSSIDGMLASIDQLRIHEVACIGGL